MDNDCPLDWIDRCKDVPDDCTYKGACAGTSIDQWLVGAISGNIYFIKPPIWRVSQNIMQNR